jgi:hypothetical protein
MLLSGSCITTTKTSSYWMNMLNLEHQKNECLAGDGEKETWFNELDEGESSGICKLLKLEEAKTCPIPPLGPEFMFRLTRALRG